MRERTLSGCCGRPRCWMTSCTFSAPHWHKAMAKGNKHTRIDSSSSAFPLVYSGEESRDLHRPPTNHRPCVCPPSPLFPPPTQFPPVYRVHQLATRLLMIDDLLLCVHPDLHMRAPRPAVDIDWGYTHTLFFICLSFFLFSFLSFLKMYSPAALLT